MGVDPFTLALGAAVLGGGSKVLAGRARQKSMNSEGDAQFQEALGQARNIRRDAREVRSAARAGYSASGVVTDEGTPAYVDADITRRSEEDALNTILTGTRRRSTLRREGRAAMIGGTLDAAGTALSFGSSAASGGWRK